MFRTFIRKSVGFQAAAAAAALATVLGVAACPGQNGEANAAPPGKAAKGDPVTPATIANFTLKDQNGAPHELYKMTNAKAIVITLQGVGCPIVQKMTPDLK